MSKTQVKVVKAVHIQCPECNSREVRYRQMGGNFICRRCGCFFTARHLGKNYEMKPDK